MSEVRLGFRKKLLFSAVVFIGALLGAEILVRIVNGAPSPERLPVLQIRAHPTRGWEMVPNHLHYNYEHPVLVNDIGLRGPSLGDKEPGERRILALGDSLVYGQGVAEEETIPALMGKILAHRSAGTPIRVVNGGLRAYATNQEIALLRELVPRIEPDIVVVFWYWNDLEDEDVEHIYRTLEPRGQVSFFDKVRLEGWQLVRWRAYQLLRRSALLNATWDWSRGLFASFPDERAIDEGMKTLAGHLTELVEIAAQQRFAILFTVVPYADSLRRDHPTDAILERAQEAARQAGIPVVSLREPLRELVRRTGKLPIIPYDHHYDAVANEVMAETVVGALPLLPIAR